MTKANINKFKAIWIMICVIALLALNPTANVLAQGNKGGENPESFNEEDDIKKREFDKLWKGGKFDWLFKHYIYARKNLAVLEEHVEMTLEDIQSQTTQSETKTITTNNTLIDIKKTVENLRIEQNNILGRLTPIETNNEQWKKDQKNVSKNTESITNLNTQLGKLKETADNLHIEQNNILGRLKPIEPNLAPIEPNNEQGKKDQENAESRSTWGIINNLQFILIVILIICLIALCVIAYIHLLHGPYRNRSVSRTKTPNEGYSEHVQTYSYQPKEINKSNLISWWNENGAKPPLSCSESLKEEFGNNCSHKFIRKGGSDKNDWKLIKIREYMLPRKDSPYKDNIIEKWFTTEDKEVKTNSYIVSLIEPAKTMQGRDEAISKGNVKISEIKSRSEEKLTDVGKKSDIANRVITEPETKPLTKNNLIDWWDKNSAKTYTKCKDIIKEEFGNNTSIEAIEFNPNDKEEWYLIGIAKNTSSEFYYVLPRKYDFTVGIKNWFEAKEGSTSRDASISSLKKLAMMQANITPRTPSAKGEVTLKF